MEELQHMHTQMPNWWLKLDDWWFGFDTFITILKLWNICTVASEQLTKMQEYSWLDIKFYCILLEQDWQIGGEDRWWGVMILGEDFVNCGCREVFVRLQYGTDDSTSPSTKASTFDPPLSIWCPSILVSRLVLLICWANFFGVVRSSSVSRAISFFSCHISNRRQLIKIGGTKSQILI